ncbi:MAG TPA: nitroreductase [Alphaproteobacteria bacterium]|nr:nitroreductase [Alphaproteobacteria bacterium]
MNHNGVLSFLKNRRSSKLASLSAPAPSPDELHDILTIAARVPDHGKYHPWYFIVLKDQARQDAGQMLRASFEIENPDTVPAKLDLEAERFLRAPLVIAVVSRIREGKHPQWEQFLSSGAACYNLCLAANAMGYGSNWLTEWYSYSPIFKKLMGLDQQDHFAGFIYIGTTTEQNEERERPDLKKIVTYWSKDTISLNKGEGYGILKAGFPDSGVEPL